MARDDDPELLVRLLDRSPGMVILVDAQVDIRWINQTAADLFGFEPEELIGRSVLEFLDPDWDPEAFDSIGTALGGQGLRQPMLFRVIARDGSRHIVEVTANVQLHDPVVNGMVTYVRPWTERYLLDQALDAMAARRPVEETLRLLVDVASAETMDAPAAVLHGRDGDRVLGVVASPDLPVELVGPVPGVEAAVAAAWTGLLDGIAGVGDVLDVDDLPAVLRVPAAADGYRTLWLWPSDHRVDEVPAAWALAWRREPHLDIDQTRRQLMARLARLAGLVIDRARSEELTAHAASHDALTGLANRAAFYDALESAVSDPAAAARSAEVGVLYLDLDGFKPVNDRYGHGVGDRVLAHVARRLATASPPSALVGRLGGDEFGVVCAHGTGAHDPVAVATALADAVARPIDVGLDAPVVVGVSAGVAVAAAGTCTADALVDAADRALYEAKRAGGGIRVGSVPLVTP